MSDIKPINRRAKFVLITTLVTPEAKFILKLGKYMELYYLPQKSKDGF